MKTVDEIAGVGNWSASRGPKPCDAFGHVAFVLGLVACIHLAFWALKNPATTAAPWKIGWRAFRIIVSRALLLPDGKCPRRGFAPISRQSPGRPKRCAPMLPPRGWSGCRRLRLNSGLRSRLAPGSITTKPETSVRSRQPSNSPDTIPMSSAWSSAMKPCSGRAHCSRNGSDYSARETESPVPVGSAENWRIFIEHPELGNAVDQIFAHIIPYWEGVPKGDRRRSVPGDLRPTAGGFPGQDHRRRRTRLAERRP